MTPAADAPVIERDPILGDPIGHYPSDRFRLLLIAGVITGATAVVLNFTTAALPEPWGPALTIILMAGVGLALGWYVLHLWNREIILFDRGFTYREGSNVVYLLYSEIRGVRLRAEQLAYFGGLFRRNVYTIHVRTVRDERFTITNVYRRAPELGSKLAERIHATLAAALDVKFAAGECLAFGETLSACVDGLRESGRVLPWTDYARFTIGDRRLTIFTTAGEVWYALPLAEVENITLLLDLLRRHRQEQPA